MGQKKKENKTISKLLTLNPYVKDTWTEYAANALTPKYYICRYDDKKGNRFYYFKRDNDVVIAAGSTTIFGRVSTERENIDKWKESHPDWKHLLDITSEYGTIEHEVQGDIMFGSGVIKSKLNAMQDIIVKHGGSHNMPSKDVLAFMRFQEDYHLTPMLIEASLVWQDPVTGAWLAQTIDLLAKMTVTIKTKTQEEDGVYQRGVNKGKPRLKDLVTEEKIEKVLIVDFKGNFFDKDRKSFFETNKLQLQAAKLAVEQNFDIKVDDVYNYAPNNWRTVPSYTFYRWDLNDNDWEIFNTYWKLVQLKGYNKPEGKMLVTKGFENSNDFKFLTYEEYVKEILLN